MALTGLDIYKLLPKTNCGDCGLPTCLAFAMKLAAKQARLEKCPHVSPEAAEKLQQASRPPIELVTIGTGENRVELGNETVLFRHLQTFRHPTAIAVTVDENDPGGEERLRTVNSLRWERVGEEFGAEMIALVEKSGDPESFAGFAERTLGNTKLCPVMVSDSPDCLEAALKVCGDRRPLLYAAGADNFDRLVELAKRFDCPLAIRGRGTDETAELSERAAESGLRQLVLDTSPPDTAAAIQDQTRIRRFALDKLFRPFGYPTLVRLDGGDPFSEALSAAALAAKYASILITGLTAREYLFPLLTARQNIFTDPQKPVQVEPGLYPVNDPGRDAPVLVTTNFSLTYFIVRGEIESSRIGAHLLVTDTEGTSVLTAWAADKLNPGVIARGLEDTGAAGKVDRRRLVLPGYVAVLSGKVEEETGWEVNVGPREASGITGYLKRLVSG